MRKKSHALLLIGLAALASAVMVSGVIWVAGLFRSAVCVFFLLATLVGWLKITAFKRARKERMAAVPRHPLSVSPPLSTKRIQSFPGAQEKISA